MHLGQRNGEREAGAEDRVREAVRRDVGGGAQRHAVGVQDGAFGHHLNLFLEFAASRRWAIVGLGSDFDGADDLFPEGMEDISKTPNLVRGLMERGFSDDDILKILGGNTLRVMRDVERAAK